MSNRLLYQHRGAKAVMNLNKRQKACWGSAFSTKRHSGAAKKISHFLQRLPFASATTVSLRLLQKKVNGGFRLYIC